MGVDRANVSTAEDKALLSEQVHTRRVRLQLLASAFAADADAWHRLRSASTPLYVTPRMTEHMYKLSNDRSHVQAEQPVRSSVHASPAVADQPWLHECRRA